MKKSLPLLLIVSGYIFASFNFSNNKRVCDKPLFVMSGSNAPLASVSVVPDDEFYENQLVALNHINGLEDAWAATQGKGTTVAVIDTGIDYNHPDFKDENGNSNLRLDEARYYAHVTGNGSTGYQTADSISPLLCFETNKSYILNKQIYSGYEIINHNGDNTHGTNVAATVAAYSSTYGVCGIAPKAKILPLKVDMYLDSIAAALNYVVNLNSDDNPNNNVDVVNLSLQSKTTWQNLHTQIDALVNQDVIVVAAGGNYKEEERPVKTYPACIENVIGVGALARDSSDTLASYSNYNTLGTTNVNIVAPGTVYTADANSKFKEINGTSFACPIVAGAACLWKSQNPSGTLSEFTSLLYSTATDLGEEGFDTTFGNGALNLENLIDLEKTIKPTSITINAENTSVFVNKTINLTSTVFPNETTNKEVIYTSLNPSIAKVVKGGVIKGLSAGEATIRATSKIDSTVYSDIKITVDDSFIGVDSIAITNVVEDDYNEFDIGTEYALNFEVYPSNATNKEVIVEYEDAYGSEGTSFDLTNDFKLRVYSSNEIYFKITSVDNPEAVFEFACLFRYSETNYTLYSIRAVYEGEEVHANGDFDYDSITVTAHYVRGIEEEDITSRVVTGWTHTDLDLSSKGEKTITISYVEGIMKKTTTLKINVLEEIIPDPIVVSLSATYVGPELKVGDAILKGNFDVYAHYDNESSKKVVTFTISKTIADIEGSLTITVSYTENEITVSTNVVINVIKADIPTEPSEKGCGGSLVTPIAVISLVSSLSVIFLLEKKKRQ